MSSHSAMYSYVEHGVLYHSGGMIYPSIAAWLYTDKRQEVEV